VLWVLWIPLSHMEFCFFLIPRVLGIRVHSFLFKSFPNNLTFDQFLSFSEISELPHYLWVCRHNIFFQIHSLWSGIALHPWWAVLLTCSIIETALSCLCKCVFSRLIAHFFIYNLNNNCKTYSSLIKLSISGNKISAL
jgi:hypothetical protein